MDVLEEDERETLGWRPGRRRGHGGRQRLGRRADAADDRGQGGAWKRGRYLARGAAMADDRPCWHWALPRSPPATSPLLPCLIGERRCLDLADRPVNDQIDQQPEVEEDKGSLDISPTLSLI